MFTEDVKGQSSSARAADRRENTQQPFGNFLAIADKTHNVTTILGHLQKGSIASQQEEAIHKGHYLGLVGNSSRTPNPISLFTWFAEQFTAHL